MYTKHRLGTLAFMLLAVCFTTRVIAQDRDEPYLVKSFSANVKTVESTTNGGNIEVSGGSETKVEVYIRGNNDWNKRLSKEEIQERLAKYELTVEQQGDKVVAKAKRLSGNGDWKNGLSISFKIFTPGKISTNLRTSGGNIRLTNIDGKQNFTTSGGNLELTSLRGTVDGRTSGGNVNLEDCHDEIEVVTSGGNIRASNSDGRLSLTTSGGNLQLKELSGKIEARTSGGNVNADNIKGELRTSTSGGQIDLDGIEASVEASTSGGGITASINKVGDYLRLNTSAGNIRVNMPLKGGLNLDVDGERVSVTTLNNFSGKIEKDRVVGKLNGGGAPVEISASSGNVTLNDK